MALVFLSKLEDKICQPSPTFFPDSEQRQELFARNQWQFRFYMVLVCVFLTMFKSINLESEPKLFFLSYLLLHLLSCLAFCRTRVWIYYWIYALSATFMELGFVMYMKKFIIYALMECFVAPLFVLVITNNLGCAFFTFVAKVPLMHLKYKPILVEILQVMPVEDFASNFIVSATYVLIAITLSYGALYSNLKNTLKELKTSKQKTEEAFSQLESFVQTFSHELRNPLNSLLGNINLTLQENLSPKVFEMVESAKICGELLLQLINNILDTGKISMRKLEVSPTSSCITDLIGSVWRISRDLIKKKNLNGYLKIDRNLPPLLHLDCYRINQILLNLIGNSIKFTSKGNISVSLEWLEDTKVNENCFYPHPYDDMDEGIFERMENFKAISPNNGITDYFIYVNSSNRIDLTTLDFKCNKTNVPGVLKIIVKDTGCGIKKEDLPSVFTKFTQFHKDLSHKKIGTGLGLYIVKEIVEKMRGQINVYSKYGQGTTFVVCIPTYCPMDVYKTMGGQETILYLKEKKIQALLVDDNIFNLDLFANYARKVDGRVVDKAQNGSDGLRKYIQYREQRISIDIVFLDIDMPIMDGRTMCNKIREYEHEKNLSPVKIVFVSGNYGQSEIQELLDKFGHYKADGFLKKPVTFEAFTKITKDVILSS